MQQDWNRVIDVSHCMGQLLGAASAKFIELGGVMRGHRVLDLACGVGAVAAEIAPKVTGNGGSVLGIDSCPEMIAAARRMHANLPALQFEVRDAQESLGTPDQYDSVFCRFSLPFVTNPAAALASSFAALKPGGRMCIMSIADGAHNELVQVLERIGSPLVAHVLQLGHPAAIAHELESAGFQNVLTKRIRALVTVKDPQAYWHCVRGLFGFADAAMPAALASVIKPGARMHVSFVFALGRKHDPNAEVKYEIQTADDAIALARRKTREIAPLSLTQTFKRETVVYLDVRPPAARLTKIKDSINVTRDELEERLAAMVPDPAAVIVVYCQDGTQSALATGQLRAMGYTNVWSLQGGMQGWEYVGMRTVPA